MTVPAAHCVLHAGFAPQIRRIASELPAARQTLLYSATWPREVRHVAASFATREPLHVFIGNVSVRVLGCGAIPPPRPVLLESV